MFPFYTLCIPCRKHQGKHDYKSVNQPMENQSWWEYRTVIISFSPPHANNALTFPLDCCVFVKPEALNFSHLTIQCAACGIFSPLSKSMQANFSFIFIFWKHEWALYLYSSNATLAPVIHDTCVFCSPGRFSPKERCVPNWVSAPRFICCWLFFLYSDKCLVGVRVHQPLCLPPSITGLTWCSSSYPLPQSS